MTTMPGRTTVPAGKKKRTKINEKNAGDSKWWYIDPGNDYDIDESINWLLTDLKGLDGTILDFIF